MDTRTYARVGRSFYEYDGTARGLLVSGLAAGHKYGTKVRCYKGISFKLTPGGVKRIK